MLKLVAQLYAFEKLYRANGTLGDERLQRRQDDQARILRRLRRAIEISAPRALPRSKLGNACSDALAHWKQLVAYLDDGEAEIDNNLVVSERSDNSHPCVCSVSSDRETIFGR